MECASSPQISRDIGVLTQTRGPSFLVFVLTVPPRGQYIVQDFVLDARTLPCTLKEGQCVSDLALDKGCRGSRSSVDVLDATERVP